MGPDEIEDARWMRELQEKSEAAMNPAGRIQEIVAADGSRRTFPRLSEC